MQLDLKKWYCIIASNNLVLSKKQKLTPRGSKISEVSLILCRSDYKSKKLIDLVISKYNNKMAIEFWIFR